MSEANQPPPPASVVALMAMAEGPLNDILNRLHGSSLAKALAEGGYEIVITAKGNDTSPSPMPYFTNAVMVPTREHADDRAEIRRLQNEMRKANDMIEEQAGRIAKLEQQLGHALEERDQARGELPARMSMPTNPAVTPAIRIAITSAAIAVAEARRSLSQKIIHLEDVLHESGIVTDWSKQNNVEATESDPMPDWAGRTQVVREPPPGSDKDPSGGPVRYIEITSIDGPSASGTWKHGDEHVFCRYTGRCLESSNGAMQGWMIAPHEMHRHCAKADGAGDNGGAS